MAIGVAWADGSWNDNSWAVGAWNAVSSVVSGATNQGSRQAAWRTVTGLALTYNGDFIAYANSLGYTGTYNECLIQYLQNALSSTETNINSLMAAAAIDRGKVRWSDLGSDVTSIGT